MKSLEDKRREVIELLRKLKSFPKTKTVRQLHYELTQKLSEIDRRIRESEVSKRREQVVPDNRAQKKKEANLKRSKKMKQKHHYIRLIRDNYPGHSYRDIWRWYSERKRGRKVPVPDVIWRNPSP